MLFKDASAYDLELIRANARTSRYFDTTFQQELEEVAAMLDFIIDEAFANYFACWYFMG